MLLHRQVAAPEVAPTPVVPPTDATIARVATRGCEPALNHTLAKLTPLTFDRVAMLQSVVEQYRHANTLIPIDAWLVLLTPDVDLPVLDLSSTNFCGTQAAMDALARVSKLRALNVARTAFDDKACARLAAACPRLTALSIADTRVTDRGLKPLGKLALRYFNADAPLVSARGLCNTFVPLAPDLSVTPATVLKELVVAPKVGEWLQTARTRRRPHGVAADVTAISYMPVSRLQHQLKLLGVPRRRYGKTRQTMLDCLQDCISRLDQEAALSAHLALGSKGPFSRRPVAPPVSSTILKLLTPEAGAGGDGEGVLTTLRVSSSRPSVGERRRPRAQSEDSLDMNGLLSSPPAVKRIKGGPLKPPPPAPTSTPEEPTEYTPSLQRIPVAAKPPPAPKAPLPRGEAMRASPAMSPPVPPPAAKKSLFSVPSRSAPALGGGSGSYYRSVAAAVSHFKNRSSRRVVSDASIRLRSLRGDLKRIRESTRDFRSLVERCAACLKANLYHLRSSCHATADVDEYNALCALYSQYKSQLAKLSASASPERPPTPAATPQDPADVSTPPQ